MKHTIEVALLVVVAACSSSRSSDPGSGARGSGSPPAADGAGVTDEAWRTCSTDADCELMVSGCCDHCNGGTLLSTNGKHAIPDRYRRDCSDISCTMIECAPLSVFTPVCAAQRCGYREAEDPNGAVIVPP